MKQRGFITNVTLVGIIIVVGIMVGAYYLYSQNHKQLPIGQENKSVAAKTVLPKGSSIGKETFSSARCSLSLNYPGDWKAIEPNNDLNQDYQYVCVDIQAPNYKISDGGFTGTQIHITRTKLGITFTISESEKYVINSIDDLIRVLEGHPYSGGKVQNKQTKVITGISGTYYEWSTISSISVIKAGYIYSINYPKTDDNSDITQEIINSIKI